MELTDGTKCTVIGTKTDSASDYDILTEFQWYALGDSVSERYYPRWFEIEKINGIDRDQWEKQQIARTQNLGVEKLIKSGKRWSLRND